MARRTQLGIAGTGLWLALAAVLVWSKRCTWPGMTLNQWGDLFAGVVAPVAFLWLILGYFQQGEEVRSNTETLQLQQKALQQQVEGTAALVRNAEEQTKAAVARLELEQSKWERRRAEEKARIQPVFVFTGGTGTGADWQLTFKNTGGVAKHLTVVSVHPPCQVGFASGDFVEAGGTGGFTVNGITTYPTRLTIAYLDQHNEEGRMELEIHRTGMFRMM